jgi:BASS family bile acid:Na+ symporter
MSFFRFDYATLEYAQFEYALCATQLVLVTVAMGMKLRLADFGRILRAPRGLALLFLGQLVLTPLIALAINAAFDLPPGFAAGMVLISAMPTGTLASVLVYLGRGHTALAIAGTGLTTVASLATTTAVLQVFGSSQLAKVEMPVGRMIAELSVCLLLPLAGAMWLGHAAPHRSRQVAKWCMRGCGVTLTTLVIGAFVSGRLEVFKYGWTRPAALFVFAAATFLVCYLLCLAVTRGRSESFTVGSLATLRNGNLALLLKASLFPVAEDPTGNVVGDAVLYVIMLYSGASVIISACTVLIRLATTRRPIPEVESPRALVARASSP